MKILCLGMIMCDQTLYPIPGKIMHYPSSPIQQPKVVPGGDAVNVAKTLRILGAPMVLLSGLVGSDIFGKTVIEHVMEAGINTDYVLVDDTLHTAVSYHLIDAEGKHHALFYTALHEDLSAAHFDARQFEGAGIVYFGSALAFPRMDNGGIEQLFTLAHQHGALTALDTKLLKSDPSHWRMLDGCLRQTDIFIPSLREAEYLTGEGNPSRIAHRMARFGMKIFGIKLGREGSYLTDFRNEYYVSAFTEFAPIDTVGAGDSYMGSLLYGLSQGWALERCATLASVVSSFNVSMIGATAGVPNLETALAYLKTHPASIEKRAYDGDR